MKKSKKIDPFKDLVLNAYEKELEAFFDEKKAPKAKNFQKNKRLLEIAAERHLELKGTRSVTLRVNKGDLVKVRAKAKRNNVPYQTLINLLITKYAEGEVQLSI